MTHFSVPQLPRDAAGQIDWLASRALLTEVMEEERDAWLDLLVDHYWNERHNRQAQDVVLFAITLAQSPFVLQRVAGAVTTVHETEQALDVLNDLYRQHRQDEFLSAILLKGLGVLALREEAARPQVKAHLVRMKLTQDSPLLVAACKVLGFLLSLESDSQAHKKLLEFQTSPEPTVQAEATFQLGMCQLKEAFQSSDVPILLKGLDQARGCFQAAAVLEEWRPDSVMLGEALGALIKLMDAGTHQAILEHQRVVKEVSWGLMKDPSGLQSPQLQQLTYWCNHLLDQIVATSAIAQQERRWVNFAVPVHTLAHIHAQLQGQTALAGQHPAIEVLFDRTAEVYAHALGPLMKRAINEERLQVIIDETPSDQEDTLQSLRVFQDAVKKLPYTVGLEQEEWSVTGDNFNQLNTEEALEGLGGLGDLPVKNRLFGGTYLTDRTMRPQLKKMGRLLHNFPTEYWEHIVEVFGLLLKFAQKVREIRPAYVCSVDTGGLGIQASERDLQNHLLDFLKLTYDQQAINEHTEVAGGRVDLMLILPHMRIPIEIKHETTNIEPEHITRNYLVQADKYAASCDKFAVLMVLDIREENADPLAPGLYGPTEPFEVLSRPVDPQVPGMQPNVVLVGLIRGNQPLPSSTTQYSRKPKPPKPRKKRTDSASE